MDIGSSSLPLGHSLLLNKNKPDKLETFSIPRSSLFESLHSFLPQFVQSCEEVQREIAETGTTKFAVEELISDDDSDDDSTSTSDSTSDSDESAMSEEEEEKEEVPSIEMRLAVAPMETVEMIENVERELSESAKTKTKTQSNPLVTEM